MGLEGFLLECVKFSEFKAAFSFEDRAVAFLNWGVMIQNTLLFLVKVTFNVLIILFLVSL